MRSKIIASLFIFIISTQVFSLVTWASIALEFANGNTSSNITLLIIDEEIEEDGVKIQNCNYLTDGVLHFSSALPQINKEVQYLHLSEALNDGFKSIPYNPPNC